ncbi:hypothetical protein [Paenibacillus marinisediminis]
MLMSNDARASDSSRIRIGIVGPELQLPTMAHCLSAFPSFEPLMKGYRKEEDADKLALSLVGKVEVIVFTGPVPYQLAIAHQTLPLPLLFVPLSSSVLYRSLLRLDRLSGDRCYSVDTLSKSVLKSALKELGIANTEWPVYEGDPYPTVFELVQYHLAVYRSGHSHGALTSVRSVAVHLRKEGVPCEWIQPSEQDIIVTLERALLSTEWRRNKEAQIVIGYIHISESMKQIPDLHTELEDKRSKADIQHIILNFAKSLEGHIQQLNEREYMLVTSRGIFERETGGYKYIPLSNKAQHQKVNGHKISIGIGFGYTAGDAGNHARHSLRLALDSGGETCFIVREDASIVGPLEMSIPNEFNLSLVDTELIKRAEAAGMTSLYLSKLMAHTVRSGQLDYYAQELSETLGVTVRTVHRFLLAWTDAGLVEIIGEEKGASRGRPRLRYRISFLSKLVR